MRSTSGYASISCIFFHQLQPRDSMASITRGLPNDKVMFPESIRLEALGGACLLWAVFLGHVHLPCEAVNKPFPYLKERELWY